MSGAKFYTEIASESLKIYDAFKSDDEMKPTLLDHTWATGGGTGAPP